MGIGIYELIVLFVIISILALPFWIISLIDILKSKFEGNDKIVWLLVLIFLGIPGMILYRVIGKKQKIIIQEKR
ncbi:MAG: PLDc N-terminal domain-containing protein [Smithellaceae bacterium]|nr:PLDc N-terminal domain-containing protein [Smithellaceae bacterium]